MTGRRVSNGLVYVSLVVLILLVTQFERLWTDDDYLSQSPVRSWDRREYPLCNATIPTVDAEDVEGDSHTYHSRIDRKRVSAPFIHPSKAAFPQATVKLQTNSTMLPIPVANVSAIREPPHHYLEYLHSVGGLGNNLLGLVSVYVIAAIMNYTMVFDSNYSFDPLFSMTDIYDQPIQRNPTGKRFHRVQMVNWCFRRDAGIAVKLKKESLFSIFNHSSFALSTNCPLFSWLLYNEENYNALVRIGLLEDIPYRSRDPRAHSFYLMSTIFRKHTRVSPLIRESVDQRIRGYRNSTLVGFHIRKGDRQSDFKETRDFIFGDDVYQFVRCPVVWSHPDAVLFVASDSTNAKKVIEANTNHKVVTVASKARHSNGAMGQRKDINILAESFTDLLTVGSCDYVVGTWKSTFSVVAAAFQGHMPYFVARRKACFQPNYVDY